MLCGHCLGEGRGGSRAPQGRGTVPTLGAGRKEETDQVWRLDREAFLTTGQDGSALPQIEGKAVHIFINRITTINNKGILHESGSHPPISSNLKFQR